MIRSPLDFNISSSIASERYSYRSSHPRPKMLVIVQQAYAASMESVSVVKEAQENIYKLCKRLYLDGGIRFVAVEGSEKNVQPTRSRSKSIAKLLKESHISAGVLKLLNSLTGSVAVYGVDSMTKTKEAWKAQAYLKKYNPLIEYTFSKIRKLLSKKSKKIYPRDIWEIRKATLEIYKERLAITDTVKKLARLKERYRIKLEDFPALYGMYESSLKESIVDFSSAEQERNLFITQILNLISVNLKKEMKLGLSMNRPMFNFISNEASIPLEELQMYQRHLGPRGFYIFCQKWYYSWIYRSVIFARQDIGSTGGGQAALLERVERLSEKLNFPLKSYQNLYSYYQYISKVSREVSLENVMNEFNEIGSVLTGRLNKVAADFGDIEEKLNSIYLALRMELPPEKAEFLEFKAGDLLEILEKIIPRNPFRLKFNNALKIADKAHDSAEIYLRTSLERSKHMVEKSLEKMEELNHDRGILVIGGFHTRGALRYLSEQRNVSWSVFLPKFTMR